MAIHSILTHIKGDTNNRITIAYARVSSDDQKEDLERQEKVLEMYCASKGWDFEIISDLGSGINYNKKGLKKLLVLKDIIKSSFSLFFKTEKIVNNSVVGILDK